MLEEYLQRYDNQFGFRKQHSMDMCISTMKSVVRYYTKQKVLDTAKVEDQITLIKQHMLNLSI